MAVMRPWVTPVVRPLFRTCNPISGSCPASATDPQDLGRDEPRLDRLGDRGIDEIGRTTWEPSQAPARGVEEGCEEPGQEARDGPRCGLLELDRHEIGEACNRVLQAASVGGAWLQDRVTDPARVLVREDVVVR